LPIVPFSSPNNLHIRKTFHFHNLFIVLKSIHLWQSKATMWEWPKGIDQRGWATWWPLRIRDLWPVRFISCLEML
jgi:hypothetical protein